MTEPFAHLRRYQPIIDDWDAFLAATERPIPPVLWANPLRVDPERAEATLRARFPHARALPWWPHAWRLYDEEPAAVTSVGRWLPYRLGWFHAQEEAALWPARLLGAQPGDRVLDMCAAPGNKTAQIALSMKDQGLIVANDRTPGRLAALRFNLERLGVTCAVVTRGDGLRMPREPRFFDRVLVDAPCSCEGTQRKRDRQRDATTFRRGIRDTQVGLLRRALQVVKPGGTVVYATCTYAPEENEGVLDAIDPAVATIEQVTPPTDMTVAPGISAWDGKTFRADVRHAVRLWPHHNDTGGFFVARLRHLG